MSTERPRRNGGGNGTSNGASKALAARDSEVRLAAAADSTHASDPWNAAVEEGRKLDLAEYPSALLLRVASVIHQESTGGYARKYGLSVPEWRILGRLCESAPMRLTTLCRVSYFDKAQATRVLRSLSARRLVRTFADPSHRHRRIVDITPNGRRLAQAVFPEAAAEQLKLLRALSPEERRITFGVLRKLLAVYGAGIPAPAATYRDYPS